MTEVTLFVQHFKPEGPRTLEAFKAQMQGYEGLKIGLEKTSDAVITEVKTSNLRGRGGAGFPTGMKWGFIPKESKKPKYVVCNADESEPGTFKDRQILRYMPHQLIEGMIIAGYAIGSNIGYIYIRGEYTVETKVLQEAIDEAYAAGYLGKPLNEAGFKFDITVHRGAGAYICGEETALLNSLEGKRGEPRVKPPFPAQSGLFGGPTIVNNVETLASVPFILKQGGAWYSGLGVLEKSGGTRLFSLSGHVERPGVYEVRAGSLSLRQLIDQYGGGVLGGKKIKAVIPGGSSAPILRPEELDVIADIDPLAKIGTMLGSAAVMVIAEGTCLVRLLRRITRFYAHESCGQCTPCREGCAWMERILTRILHGKGSDGDVRMLEQLAGQIGGKTLCALGDAAAGPVLSFVRKFPSEFQGLLKGEIHA